MKTIFLLLFILASTAYGFARENDNLILGTWKYSTQSATNDFRKVLTTFSETYTAEYFVFETNNKFLQEFVNDRGEAVKTLEGNWKTNGDKIQMCYTHIDFNIDVSYFFLDKDLVMGQNFNHVIFTRYIDPSALPL